LLSMGHLMTESKLLFISELHKVMPLWCGTTLVGMI
jgi:hypothetical protein